MARKRQVLVVGLGRFGSAVATTLAELDCEVACVDSHERPIQQRSGRSDEWAPCLVFLITGCFADQDHLGARGSFSPDSLSCPLVQLAPATRLLGGSERTHRAAYLPERLFGMIRSAMATRFFRS